MRLRLYALIVILLMLMTACNLGNSSRETEEPIATLPDVSTRPEISILSPANGDEFAVDEQIFVSVSASDSVGVTRVQLFADGQSVQTISSESAAGEQSFEGVLSFTPRIEGEYTLRVLAFRGAIASSPTEITVSVAEEQSQVIVTTRPGTSGGDGGVVVPQIPNDGLCRVLTNVGLNMRSEPTTTRENVITILNSGTLAVVVARLGDNSWWKVSFGATVGWVSGNPQYTTLYGNCLSIPVESVNTPTPTATTAPLITMTPTATRTPAPSATPGRPDLIVPSITVANAVVIPQGETSVTEVVAFTVTNSGQGPSGQFTARLRVGSQDFELVVSGLDAGQTVTLTQNVTFSSAGNVDIRVDVDLNNTVTEVSEVNNRGDLTITVTNG